MIKGYMYILECSDGSYYTGSTKDLEYRLQQHQAGEGANHTKKHLPVKLVYYEEFNRIDEAFYREKQVQGWSRKKKEALMKGDFDKLSLLSKNYTQASTSSASAISSASERVVELAETTASKERTATEPVEVAEMVAEPAEMVAEPTEANIPKLRFPEFHGDWIKKKISEFASIRGGGTPSSNRTEFWKGEIPWISSSDIIENDINNIQISRFISNEALKESATKIIPAKSVLVVSRVGIGKFAVNNEPICTSQDFSNLILEKVNAYFIAYLFHANKNSLINLAQGTSIKGFTGTDLASFKIFLPTLPEQQKIASFLSEVDAKIQQLKKKKELLEQYKKGMMQKLFPSTSSGELPELRFKPDASTPLSASNGNEFPKWEKKKLGEVLTIGSGKDYKHLQEGEIPVYGTGGLMTYVNDYLFDGESVGIGRKGTIDKPVYLQGKFWTVDTLFYTHSFKDVIPYFIYLIFQQINWQVYNEASGVPSLSKSTIEKIELQFPSLEEQTKIASFLQTLDEKISLVDTQLTKAETWKKGLLQHMFV